MSNDAVTLRDADIRRALLTTLLADRRDTGGATRVIEELGICRGQVRIDVAVVDCLLHGYEIKSDRDSLRRLPKQADFYNRVFDRATLVVGDRHLDEAREVVPDWWRVLRFESGPDGPEFKTVRPGRRNPQRDPRSLVELLWLDEAIALLVRRNAARGVRGRPRRMVWDRICEHFEVEEIAATVRTALRARGEMQDPVRPS